jgi:hypothetical protein
MLFVGRHKTVGAHAHRYFSDCRLCLFCPVLGACKKIQAEHSQCCRHRRSDFHRALAIDIRWQYVDRPARCRPRLHAGAADIPLHFLASVYGRLAGQVALAIMQERVGFQNRRYRSLPTVVGNLRCHCPYLPGSNPAY